MGTGVVELVMFLVSQGTATQQVLLIKVNTPHSTIDVPVEQ
jgi:hypothetical protein